MRMILKRFVFCMRENTMQKKAYKKHLPKWHNSAIAIRRQQRLGVILAIAILQGMPGGMEADGLSKYTD